MGLHAVCTHHSKFMSASMLDSTLDFRIEQFINIPPSRLPLLLSPQRHKANAKAEDSDEAASKLSRDTIPLKEF